MKDKVSIIIPVYNVENYLKKCVMSVIKQTYPHLEILLIDDGSSDKSGFICDELKKMDRRVIVFHKKNGGLSDARNLGLSKASGDYIFFLDSDDWIEPETINELIERALREQLDIVCCGYKEIDERGTVIREVTNENRNYSTEEAMVAYLTGSAIHSIACAKLYKADLFKNIRYPIGFIHEDEFTTYKLIYVANRIGNIRNPYYNYLQRNNSITKNKFSEKRLVRIDAARELYLETLNHDNKQIKRLAYIRYIEALRATYICSMKYLDGKQIIELKRYKKEIDTKCKEALKILKKEEICKKDLFLIAYFPGYYQIYRILRQTAKRICKR